MSLQHTLATIPFGGTVSNTIDKGYRVFTKMYVTGFSGPTTISMEVSNDGINYNILHVFNPGFASPLVHFTITPGAVNFNATFSESILQGVNFFRFTVNAAITTPTGCVIRLA